MLEHIYEYIIERPRAAYDTGRTLALTGGALLLAGVMGHAAVTATNASLHLARKPPLDGLGDIYSPLLTWIVPESFVGFALAGLLAAAGAALAMSANDVLRQFKHEGIDY